MKKNKEHAALYPGSFDPITLGHLDIIRRAAKMFDRIIVGVLINQEKKALFSPEERATMIREATQDIPNVEVITFSGLTVDCCKELGVGTMLRGLRAVTDFEYELQIAQTNHAMDPDVDTVFLTTDLRYAYLSSSVVREVATYGGPIEQFVPENVIPRVREKYRK